MISSSYSRTRLAGLFLIIAGLSLSACATKPDRRGPPPDRQGQAGHGDRGPARSSGTFLQPIAALFIEMDQNGDKVTTLKEVEAGAQAEWSKFDRNPSAAFFAQWSVANLGSMDARPTFMNFDKDLNGVITQAEFSLNLEREFKRLDKNNDGKVERSEMIVAFAAPQGERARKGKKDGRGGRGQGGGGRPPR